jgi:hypothetical protein
MDRLTRFIRGLGLLSILVGALVLLGAASQSETFASDVVPSKQDPPRLLIMPFKDMYDIYGPDTYRCPLTGRMHMLGVVAASADDLMTEHLLKLIKPLEQYHSMLADSASGLIAEHITGKVRISSEMDFLVAVGRDYGADVILAGYLYRFKERIGNDYAAEAPASVAFSLILIDVETSHLLWAQHFNKTQKALSENLFELSDFIKRKGRWVTARQMALAGLEEMVAALPEPDRPSKDDSLTKP